MAASHFDPGSVSIRIQCSPEGGRDVSVRAARPNAAGLLAGRPAEDAVRALPLMYGICGAAQGAAARCALAAARGEVPAPSVDPDVLAEARREHLWRLLLDWPRTLGIEPQQPAFAAARAHWAADGFVEWSGSLASHFERLMDVLRALPSPHVACDPVLPPLTADETLPLWPRLDAAFAARPVHLGEAASTGALARHPETLGMDAVAARVASRIGDIRDPSGLGRATAAAVAPGIGRAAVETARGLLLHEVTLDGDRVADYVVVAPTEWNFHPEGALRRLLQGVPSDDVPSIEAAAARAVLAFDPCVTFSIEVAGMGPAAPA